VAEQTFVIVGAGMAGAKAAETLRAEGFAGRVVLVGQERAAPYERPPLSKSYLMGQSPFEEARVHPDGFYEEQRIELETGSTAMALDVAAHTVTLDGDRRLTYDRLLLATGAVPRRPPIEGTDLDGVHLLRTVGDSDAIRGAVERGDALAVIGAGWIGCEVAAAARGRGADVTLIEYAEQPLEGVLGPRLGAFFGDVHRREGVHLLTGARVERLEGSGRVEAVRLADGSRIACTAVVIGVGVDPDTRLAEAAGLRVDRGVLADEHLRTSDPDVFAAGDVANAWRPRYGRRVRVEHWANALEQGPAAARSMLGAGEPFDALPYFFTDQYDVGIEYVGLHSPSDRLVVRGRPEERRLHAFWLADDGRLTAGMHVNEWESIEAIKQLVEGAHRVDPERLADGAVPLGEIAAAAHAR
jgi:3-phenylpropionate/trans-cinnamate dioxygenase ferredoxin reductase component